jgi:ectoine hydroxylase-related dioxygenase (phytanoyl-CoA dioxygenase family)
VLTPEQVEAFWRDGVLTVPDAVTPSQLAALRADFDGWVAESRTHDGPYGEAADGRARFDVQPGHSADRPALRRVQAPTEVSAAYYEVMADSPMVDMVADLIGPDVKLHHTKVNSKLPGAATEVRWHQDFPYTPHSNTDLVTALLMVDEVTGLNGPLEVLPGSHDGPLPVARRGVHGCGGRHGCRRHAARLDRLLRSRRVGLPDAHEAGPRVGPQPLGPVPDPVHLRLLGR